MEFLVNINVALPPGMASDERQELHAAEAVQAASLAAAGRLVRLWRIPGRTANWGLWRADDATELHDALTSLPLWPYMHIEVVPLARHPNDPAELTPRSPPPAANGFRLCHPATVPPRAERGEAV